MSKRLIASVTLSAFTLLAVPVSALPGGNPSLVTSSGRVLSQQGGSWTQGVKEITPGTRLRTAADGEAVVSLPDGSVVRLAPQSEIAFESLTDEGAVVRLERGRLAGHAGAGLQVKTERTLAQASTGEFVVNTSSQGTQLDVLAGDANLVSLDGEAISFGGEVDADIATGSELQSTQSHSSGNLVAQNGNGQDGNNDEEGTGEGDSAGGEAGGGGVNWVPIAVTVAVVGTVLGFALSDGDNNDPVPSPSGT